ncbi:MAG: hypothetical protein ABJF86_10475 [Tateyamaria sp.]|uniref:hypothetical protein n=1 Tax=Tateyamaria sp. TaxID=1929288 RepID=UPI00329566DC
MLDDTKTSPISISEADFSEGFISAIESRNDDISPDDVEVFTQALSVIGAEQNAQKREEIIACPFQRVAVQTFLGEPLPVLDRTYGQAAILVAMKLGPKAA